jgi:hypothetical protein
LAKDPDGLEVSVRGTRITSWRLIELAEDAIDAAEANTARAELADGAEPVPWDEVKRDLGL